MRAATPSTGAKLLLLTALTASGLLASATAATVYVAGAPQRPAASAARAGGRTDGSASTRFDGSRSGPALSALIDSLIDPLGPAASPDSANVAQMVALIAGDSTGASAPAWRPHDAPAQSPDARLRIYRQWARSERMPPFWAYDAGFPGVRASRDMPVTQIAALRALAIANESEADSALVHGDVDAAFVRARENIAAARHLVWQPFPIDALIGRALLSNAAKLLARTALQGNQPTVHTQATRLQSLTATAQIAPKPTWNVFSHYGASPDDPRLFAVAGDATLFPATRMLAIESMVAGACLNTREVLFGALPARHDAIDQLLKLTSDMPRAQELAPALHGSLAEFDAATMAASPTVRDEWSISAQVLAWLVPSSVSARARACHR